jgi:hypothetical protein
LKALAMVGGVRAVTVRLAMLLTGPAVGVWVVATPDVVLGLVATLLLVTLKVTVQLPEAGMLMPVNVRAVCPAVNVDGEVPLQVPPTAPATALMLTSVSENVPPVNADGLLFVSVRVTTEVPKAGIEAGLKPLEMVGADNTVSVGELLPGPAVVVCVVVTPEAVFVWTPGLLLVTLKVTVQLPLAGMLIPEKLRAVCPAVSVAGVVPVQVPPTDPATALMLTSVSVNAPPVSAMALVLERVRVTVEFAPDCIVAGLNALEMVGTTNTLKKAVLLSSPGIGVWVVDTPEVLLVC